MIFLPGLFFLEHDVEGYYGFQITHAYQFYKAVSFFAKTKEDRDRWFDHVCKAANYRDFNKYYEEGRNIGQGKFSNVFEGKSLETGEPVAIKKIDKTLISH